MWFLFSSLDYIAYLLKLTNTEYKYAYNGQMSNHAILVKRVTYASVANRGLLKKRSTFYTF